MKKVLILAYDFPPYVSVGGLRPFSWYKYIHEYGVYPVVVTRQWENRYGNGLDYIAPGSSPGTIVEESPVGTILRSPYKPNLSNRLLLKYGEKKFRLIRKIVSAYYEFAQFIWHTGPKKELYRSARAYLKAHKVDAILATADPYVLFKYASDLSKEFGIPWIADYRDPWSQSKEFQRNFVQKRWNEYMEQKILKSASALVSVSEFQKAQTEKLIKGKDFRIFTNGYDPEIIDHEVKPDPDKLYIAFAGMIYDWNPIRGFLQTFSGFVSENPDMKIGLRFYGVNIAAQIQEMIDVSFPALREHVTFIAKIPNQQFLNVLATNHVMLLFNYYSYIGTKIFDYLGIRRKILLCYSDDPESMALKAQHFNIEEVKGISQKMQEQILERTQGGIIVKDGGHLKIVLRDLYAEFLQTGAIACDSTGVEEYSRKIQVKRMAELIAKVAG